MKITVIGTGYVGLVTGTCLARYGNEVACVDVDEARVATLRRGEVPFYEPGLAEMMRRNMGEGRLSFGRDTARSLDGARACFITVGTPQGPDGSADLSFVEGAARSIGRAMSGGLLVAVKSTVPVGTNAQVASWIREELAARSASHELVMASNPEFLREGAALRDFLEPERVIVGTSSSEAEAVMRQIYSFLDPSKIVVMGPASAEMAKYASNAMLATRISFMNEIAQICERVGADVGHVRRAMGMDGRIGPKFLNAGCGYGGSCFPKDVRALRELARALGCEARIMEAVDRVNERAKGLLFEKLSHHMGDVRGKVVAVWGLSFKPKTSDVREAPAQALIRELLDAGASVRATDPRAIEETRAALGDHDGLTWVQDHWEAATGADALALVTEWDIYRQPDLARLKAIMRRALIVDGRDIWDPEDMRLHGFDYISVGRPDVLAAG
ncbi:MAG: UDP-glucose/GDP-mannose dehydrogenase family protein [Synergistaceae bacterium]|nr:UDP-glucose/GDP-mannose dehydrogenase family protein [Synergistaceae bacterium]